MMQCNLCVKVANMSPVPFSLTLNPAQWTQSDQDLLDKSSGQTTLSLVCILVFVLFWSFITVHKDNKLSPIFLSCLWKLTAHSRFYSFVVRLFVCCSYKLKCFPFSSVGLCMISRWVWQCNLCVSAFLCVLLTCDSAVVDVGVLWVTVDNFRSEWCW